MKAFDEITFMAHRIIDNQTKATNNPKPKLYPNCAVTHYDIEKKENHTYQNDQIKHEKQKKNNTHISNVHILFMKMLR